MDLSSLAFAYGAGLLAAFNPCGFVLLPTYAAALRTGQTPRGGTRSALGVSVRLTLGFVSVFTLTGLLVTLAGDRLFDLGAAASWLGVLTGVLFIAAGAVSLAGGKLPGLRLALGSTTGAFSYGVGYAAASLACALPVFLSAVVYAFDRGGVLDGLLAGAGYALGMATVVGVVVALVSTLRRDAVIRLRGSARWFGPLTGALLITAGAVLVARRWVDLAPLERLSGSTIDAIDRVRWLPAVLLAGLAALSVFLGRRNGRRPHEDGTQAPGSRPGDVPPGLTDPPGRRTSRSRSLPGLPLVLVCALILGGLVSCGDPGKDSAGYGGVVRQTSLEVGAFSLPEVTEPARRAGGVVDGGRLQMRAAPGRLLLVYFGFTNCPDVCPTTLADLRVGVRDLEPAKRDRVDLAFATVDPARDTPAVLNAYLGHFFDRFHALHGTPAEIEKVASAFLASFTVTGTGSSTEVAHTAVLYALDDTGTVRVEWPFGTDGETMGRDLDRLLSTMEDTPRD